MIAWTPNDTNPAAETVDCFIGTTAAALMLAGSAATAGASVYGAKKQASAAKAGAKYQTDSANYAADLEAKAAAEALAFAKEQEAARQREFKETQQRNYDLYASDVLREQTRYDDLQRRMQPYRQFGAGAIGQLGRSNFGTGSLGARLGG